MPLPLTVTSMQNSAGKVKETIQSNQIVSSDNEDVKIKIPSDSQPSPNMINSVELTAQDSSIHNTKGAAYGITNSTQVQRDSRIMFGNHEVEERKAVDQNKQPILRNDTTFDGGSAAATLQDTGIKSTIDNKVHSFGETDT